MNKYLNASIAALADAIKDEADKPAFFDHVLVVIDDAIVPAIPPSRGA